MGTSFERRCRDQPRQEPGKNFNGIVVPSAEEPHLQPKRLEPELAWVAAVAAADNGFRVRTRPLTSELTAPGAAALPTVPVTVTVIMPVPVVVIELTYLLEPAPPVDTSQPQALTPGKVPPD